MENILWRSMPMAVNHQVFLQAGGQAGEKILQRKLCSDRAG